MTLFTQDPDAELDYGFDWTDWLAAGETIVDYDVTATAGIAIGPTPTAEDDGIVTVWLSDGTAGATVQVTCHITTSSGRQDDKTFDVLVVETGSPAPTDTASPPAYATASELAGWLAGLGLSTPVNATGLLRSATLIVARAANRNPYSDTPTGATAAALRDATAAQVAAWVTLGLAPAAAGLDSAPVRRSKIGTADIERDTTGQADARKAVATELASEAREILLVAGLLQVDLPVWASDTDRLLDYGLAGTWPTVIGTSCSD